MLGVRMIPASVPTATRATHLLVAALVLAACGDTREPVAPPTEAVSARAPHAPQQVAAWFRLASPEVLALPRTVLAHHDEHTNRLVVGVEDTGAVPAVERALQRLGIPGDAYAIEVTEPFHYLNSTLRSEHRPTLGGIQVEWSQRICTLGFNVDHAGGRSFITNSHCTDNKGQTGNTQYYQPDHGVNATPIGIEADDPPYFRRGDCPQGRRCRYSDAARVLYVEGVGSLGRIAKTDGPGTGSLEVVGSLDITPPGRKHLQLRAGNAAAQDRPYDRLDNRDDVEYVRRPERRRRQPHASLPDDRHGQPADRRRRGQRLPGLPPHG
jgi:hypothetical protein